MQDRGTQLPPPEIGVQAGLKRCDELGVFYLLESCKILGLAGNEPNVARWDPQGFKARQEQLELVLHLLEVLLSLLLSVEIQNGLL